MVKLDPVYEVNMPFEYLLGVLTYLYYEDGCPVTSNQFDLVLNCLRYDS